MPVRLRTLKERRAELMMKPVARWGGFVVIGVAVVLVGLMGYFLISDLMQTGRVKLHFLPLFVPMVLVAWIGSTMSRREISRRPIPMLVGTCLASGRCGCCARDLRGRVADEDGCVGCGICGASWHADRWSTGRVGLEAVRYLLEDPARVGQVKVPPDDRGVMLDESAYSREKWVTSNWRSVGDSPQVIADRRQRRDAALRGMDRARERAMLQFGAIALVGGGTFVAIAKIVGLMEQRSAMSGLFAAMSLGGIFTLLSFRTNRSLRRAVLDQGLCPNCGMIMSDSARVEFDGCVSCVHCARAWKASDVKAPTTLTTPAAVPNEPEIDAAIDREGHGHG